MAKYKHKKSNLVFDVEKHEKLGTASISGSKNSGVITLKDLEENFDEQKETPETK